jgi:iron complex outermembrane receptor protein
LYQRNTKDLLNRIPVPAGTNLTNFVTTNVGSMENKGIELALVTTPILTKKVTWDFGINGAYNHNEITKLTATDDPSYQGVLTGGIAGGVGSNIQIHTVGYAPRSFFVYKQLYNENGEIIENSFEDLNGDGIVNGADKYRYKKPAADFTIGFTSRLAIGHFDFSFAGRASIGNYVYNNIQTDMGYLMRLYGSSGVLWNVNQSAVDLNVENQASLTFSDHFVKKADFMKMDHITFGYNFDKVIGDFLRLYVTVQNPLVITQYDGLDPEVNNGIDNNIYPRPRTILFGVNIEF